MTLSAHSSASRDPTSIPPFSATNPGAADTTAEMIFNTLRFTIHEHLSYNTCVPAVPDDAILFAVCIDFITSYPGWRSNPLEPYMRGLRELYREHPKIAENYHLLALTQVELAECPIYEIPDFRDLESKSEGQNARDWLAATSHEDDDPVPWFLAGVDVLNPEAFPHHRIQNLGYHYPSARILAIQTWRYILTNQIVVRICMENGPYDELHLVDKRLIAALGLDEDPYETINLDVELFRIGETFTVFSNRGKDPWGIRDEVRRELRSAKHPYLHWLALRGVADPHPPPYRKEIELLAKETNRCWPDVWREIFEYWDLENGPDGRRYRENRARYLGEDPQLGEERRPLVPMW